MTLSMGALGPWVPGRKKETDSLKDRCFCSLGLFLDLLRYGCFGIFKIIVNHHILKSYKDSYINSTKLGLRILDFSISSGTWIH